MTSYVCALCGYRYRVEKGDVENGIEPGTEFDEISDDWTCPLCGALKDDFEAAEADEIDYEW